MDAETLEKLLDDAREARSKFDDSLYAIEKYIGIDLDEIDLTSEDVCDTTAELIMKLVEAYDASEN